MSVFSVTDFFRIVALLDVQQHQPLSYQIEIISIDGKAVTTASGHVIQPDAAMTACRDVDIVVISAIEGSYLAGGFVPAPSLITWLHEQNQHGTRLLALTTGVVFIAEMACSGTILLATHWAFLRILRKRYPKCRFVTHSSSVQADRIWTTGSLNGGFDALLEMVAQDHV